MSNLQFSTDRCGFPMVQLPGSTWKIHWLPVTKIQYEIFICDRPSTQFNDAWYQEVMMLNRRLSPAQLVSSDNYFELLMTGIKPSEAELFSQWNGSDYVVPTVERWFAEFQRADALEPVEVDFVIEQAKVDNQRATQLLRKTDRAIREHVARVGDTHTLATQMLMRYGVMEWANAQGHYWGGMGETHKKLFSLLHSVRQGRPRIPNNPEGPRNKQYGTRLFAQGITW